MTITVNIGDADLSDLLAKVEAGEDVILARGGMPVAQILPVKVLEDRKKAMQELEAFRKTMPRITQEEIAEWKEIGRR